MAWGVCHAPYHMELLRGPYWVLCYFWSWWLTFQNMWQAEHRKLRWCAMLMIACTLYHSAESKELLKSDLELMSKKIFRYCNDNGLVIHSAKAKLLLSSKVNFDIDCCAKFATGLKCWNRYRFKIYELPSCPFAKVIPPWVNHFVKRTAWSLIYFLINPRKLWFLRLPTSTTFITYLI